MAWRPLSRGKGRAEVAAATPAEPGRELAALEWLGEALASEIGDSPEPRSVLVVVASESRLSGMPRRWQKVGVTVVHLWERPEGPVLPESDDPEGDDEESTPGAWDAVLLVVADRAELRTVASALPDMGRVRTVAIWQRGTQVPLVVGQRGEWPPLAEVRSRRLAGPVSGSFTGLWFTRLVVARKVLQAVAQDSADSRDPGPGQLVVGYVGRTPVPGLDAHAPYFADVREAVDPDLVVAPDVLLVSDPADADVELDPHPATGRAPLVVTDPGLEPVDELVWNPIGFVKVPDRPSLSLADLRDGAGVTDGFVRRARRARSVRVDLDTADPQDVLRLAMSGIALEVTGAQPRFAPEVQKVLASPLDLDDHLAREGWTVRLRRAVFDHHSTLAWRAGAAVDAGVTRVRTATHGLPAVSVLLVTKRPHELEGAVRTVASQVGVEVELVVGAHGFRVDRAKVAEWLGREAVVLEFDESEIFGDVLSATTAAASCSVVMKMDDDDWYAPHALHDLLMARRFSGADLVGMPAETVHLFVDGIDETVRRTVVVERFVGFVAGGTLTMSKDLLTELGGFRPVRRWVDAQLLQAVLAQGGQVYRTHGLGYVLKRRAEGHTWVQDPENFRQAQWLDRTWPGFRPPEEAL